MVKDRGLFEVRRAEKALAVTRGWREELLIESQMQIVCLSFSFCATISKDALRIRTIC